jgi:hypothetical protein
MPACLNATDLRSPFGLVQNFPDFLKVTGVFVQQRGMSLPVPKSEFPAPEARADSGSFTLGPAPRFGVAGGHLAMDRQNTPAMPFSFGGVPL